MCVAFGGGRLTAGPVAMTVGGAVVRVGDDVVRFAPPLFDGRKGLTNLEGGYVRL